MAVFECVPIGDISPVVGVVEGCESCTVGSDELGEARSGREAGRFGLIAETVGYAEVVGIVVVMLGGVGEGVGDGVELSGEEDGSVEECDACGVGGVFASDSHGQVDGDAVPCAPAAGVSAIGLLGTGPIGCTDEYGEFLFRCGFDDEGRAVATREVCLLTENESFLFPIQS